MAEHEFLPVAGHPDDDECTYRSDGTDATYCGLTRAEHDHHPNCYQNTGGIPEGFPADFCDCRVLRMIDAASSLSPESTGGDRCHKCRERGRPCDWINCPNLSPAPVQENMQ